MILFHTAVISGYIGRANSCYKIAKTRVERALQHAYVGRKLKKRDMRKLWIQRINAGARQHGITYSQFMSGIKLANISIDRKILADIAVRDPEAFGVIVNQAQAALIAK